jgi:hypothetical protein
MARLHKLIGEQLGEDARHGEQLPSAVCALARGRVVSCALKAHTGRTGSADSVGCGCRCLVMTLIHRS